MKKKICIFITSLSILGCNATHVKNESPSIQVQDTKVLTINLDEELALNQERGKLRAGKSDIIDGSIFLNDNDEVSFKGHILKKYSPITIKIGDNDEVSFTGKEYTINTMQLSNVNLIEMKDKDGKVFLEMEVIK